MPAQDNPIRGKSLEVSVIIRFGDTDPYGIVYFASYFRYCHQGIEEFLRHLGLQPQNTFRNVEEGFGLPVVGASCDFLKPVRYGDKLRMAVYVIDARSKAVTFGFDFLRDENDELTARGQATIVAIDSSWHSRALPGLLRDALTPFLPETESS